MATPSGVGALAVIRISGQEAINKTEKLFLGKKLSEVSSHSVVYGHVANSGKEIIDEVMISVFRSPKTFTKEDIVEISCHGSPAIVREIMEALTRHGIRMAEPGEFTLRAFLNGRINLVQAEAVADLISSENKAQQRVALQQLKEGFSKKLSKYREQLLNLASYLELELDFSEEDVEFAKRDELQKLLEDLKEELEALSQSYALGNVIKKGVPVALIGPPNAGKSTLLNALLEEEKAIVSAIPGTTRDYIEGEVVLNGISFRFIDTAGLRESTDEIEKIGIERSKKKLAEAAVVILLFDSSSTKLEELELLQKLVKEKEEQVLWVANKVDLLSDDTLPSYQSLGIHPIFVSLQSRDSIKLIKDALLNISQVDALDFSNDVVTNSRHYELVEGALSAIKKTKGVLQDGENLELIAFELREALHHLGQLTGEITNDEMLGNIFSKFCIGK